MGKMNITIVPKLGYWWVMSTPCLTSIDISRRAEIQSTLRILTYQVATQTSVWVEGLGL